MPKRPILIAAAVFAVLLVLTQLLVYQQYRLASEAARAELAHEATDAKDRLRNILFNDIAAANTLAIIYKQYGVPAKFDSIARQIIHNSRYAEALQITENGVVKNVYPDTSYKATIGTNVNADPMRRAEEKVASQRKDIYFVGPRRLRFGDTGILGKVPVITNNRVITVISVLTRLPALKKVVGQVSNGTGKYAFQLLKVQGRDTSRFSLSSVKPGKNAHVSVKIPEGDWILQVAYAENYDHGSLSYQLSGLGLLFSFACGLLAYRKAREPYKLNKIIDEKTEELTKSERYFRSLFENSTDAIRLLDANGNVLYQTPSSERITGYSLSERKKLLTNDLIHPDDLEEEKRLFAEALNSPGKVFFRKVRFKHKDGRYIWLEGSLRNLLNDKDVGAMVLSYSDITAKVQFENNLIESEARFRGAFEDSAIGMGLTSVEEASMGKWLKVNRSLCEMLGYTEEELLSRSFMQITHPDDLAKDLAAQDGVLRGDAGTYRLEKRYIHKNGSFVWINLNVSVIRDKEKKPLYMVAQIENISEKVESQIKFQNLVENFIVGVYILQNDRVVYVNPRVLEESGYREDEIIGMPFDSFIHPDDLDMVRKVIDARTNEGLKTVRYEARMQRKNGEPIWYEVLGGSTTYQGAPALIGTMVNITDRKAIYEELIRSEANLSSIFNTTNIGYLLLDTNYSIIALNQRMKEIYQTVANISLETGMNLIESIIPEKRENAKNIYDKVIQTNQPIEYESGYVNDGSTRYFTANVKPIHNGKSVIGICITSIDITEQKKLTQDLVDHVDAIERQNEKLREIAWEQSHIVRAPLARIMGLVDLFNGQDSEDEETRTILNYIVLSAKELDDVVKSISDKVYR